MKNMATVVSIIILLSVIGVAAQDSCARQMDLACTDYYAENGVPNSVKCFLNSSEAAVNWNTGRYDNVTASYCSPVSFRQISLTSDISTTVHNIVVLSSFQAGVNSLTPSHEVTVAVLTSDGVEEILGTVIPQVNALEGENVALNQNVEAGEQYYPFNGRTLCGGKMTYQVWGIPSMLRTRGIAAIRFYDANKKLKLHGITVDICGKYPTQSNPFSSRIVNYSVSLDSVGLENFIQISKNSWAECALSCYRSRKASDIQCSTYWWSGANRKCFLTTMKSLRPAPHVQNELSVVGKISPEVSKDYPGYSPSIQNITLDSVKRSRPDLFGAMKTRLFLTYSSETELHRKFFTISVRDMSTMAFGVSQTDRYEVSNFLSALTTNGRSTMCGTPSDQHIGNVYIDGSPTTATSSTTCDTMRHCVVSTMSSGAEESILISHHDDPTSSVCASSFAQSSLVYVSHNGRWQENGRYWYAEWAPIAGETLTDRLNRLAAHHFVSNTQIIRWAADKISGKILHTYALSGSYQNVAPAWRWKDDDRKLFFADIFCELQHTPGYDVVHSERGVQSSEYKCDTFSSLFEIAAACDNDDSCEGFTTFVSGATEVPKCLLSNATVMSSANDAFTMHKKTAHDPSQVYQCEIPSMGATDFSVMIDNAAYNSTVEIHTDQDSAAIASCTTDIVTPTSARCGSMKACATGSLRASVSKLFVRLVPRHKPLRLQCGDKALGALISFNPQKVTYDPLPSCILSSSPGSCSTISGTDVCASSRMLNGITAPADSCEVTDTVRVPAPSSLPASAALHTIVDFSQVSASLAKFPYFSVVGSNDRQNHFLLGYISVKPPSNELLFSSVGLSARISNALCTGNSSSSVGLANVQTFAVPVSLSKLGITEISFRGQGLRVHGVSFAMASCEPFPFYQSAYDELFSFTLPGVKSSSPAMHNHSGLTDWSACANECAKDSKCNAYTFFSDGNCSVLQALGKLTIPSDFETSPTVSGIRRVAGSVLRSTDPVPPSWEIGTVSSVMLARAPRLYLVVANPQEKRMTVAVRAVSRLQLAVAQTSFAGKSLFAAAVSSHGFGQVCGGTFSPFDGSQASSTKCGDFQTCEKILTGTALNSHLTMTFHSNSTQSTICKNQLSVLVSTDGYVVSGAEHYLYVMGEVGSVTATSLTLSETLLITNETGREFEVGLGEHDTRGASNLLGATGGNRLYCRISQRDYFAVARDQVPVGDMYNCDAFTDIDSMTAACVEDPACAGFVVNAETNQPLCMTSVNKTKAGSGHYFGRVLTRSCRFSLVTPGHIELSIEQMGLHSGSGNDVDIFINGRLMKTCGSSEPFVNGFANGVNECGKFYQCLNTVVAWTGEIEVRFPLVKPACGERLGAVMVSLTPARASSIAYHLTAGRLPTFRSIRANTPAIDIKMLVSGVTMVAVLVKQDRYDCIGLSCQIFFALNVSVGPHIFGRCGGSVGFEDGRGLSDQCQTFMYCGNTIVERGAPVASAISQPVSGELRVQIIDHNSTTTSSCDQFFEAHVFTNGVLLASHASYSHMRMLMVFPVNTTDEQIAIKDAKDNVLRYSQLNFPELDLTSVPIVYERLFNRFDSLDNFPSGHYVMFDQLRMKDELKVVSNGMVSCIVDTTTDSRVRSACRIKVNNNHVTVRIAQSNFDASNEFVTVKVNGNSTKKCGGDGLFFGNRGLQGQCNSYFVCFQDFVPIGAVVEIEFSEAVTGANTECMPGAVSLLEVTYKEPIRPVDCTTSEFPFPCPLLGKCFPTSVLCNNVDDCPDASDEGRCVGWNFVESGVHLGCAPLAVFPPTSLENCIRLAIGAGTPTALTMDSSSCSVYDCIKFDSPAISVSNESSQELHIYTHDPSSFKYCTDALHCNNNGKVASSIPPCFCTCDVQYIGSSCGSFRDLSLIESVIVEFDTASTMNGTVLLALTRSVQIALGAGYTVSVDSVDTTAVSIGVKLAVKDAAAVGAENSVLQSLLSRTSTAMILSKVAEYGAIRVTANSVVGNSIEVPCRKRSLVTDGLTCNGKGNINETQSVSVSVPGITFTNPSQSVTVKLTGSTGNTTVVCTHADFTQERNPLVSGLCSYQSTCVKRLPPGISTQGVEVTLTSTVNPTGITCDGLEANFLVTVEGNIELFDSVESVQPTTSISRDQVLFYIFLVLLLLGIGCLILLGSWVKLRLKFEAMKFAGPLFGGLAFFLLFFAIVVVAFYVDTAITENTHRLIIEEYRDDLCSESRYSFIPHRISFVEINGICQQLASIGAPEGITYLSVAATANRSGLITIKKGGTLESCNSATEIHIASRSCLSEEVLFPHKVGVEQNYIVLISLPNDVAKRRTGVIEGLNPPAQLSSWTTMDGLTIGERYNAIPGEVKAFVGSVSLSNPALEKKGTAHTIVVNGSKIVPEARLQSHSSRVRFIATLHTEATLFERADTHYLNSTPLLSESDQSVFTNVGVLFNGFGTGKELSGEAASVNAWKYYGMEGTHYDIGSREEVTITFWIKATNTTRGIVYALVDNWFTKDQRSPIIERLLEVIENSAETVEWFDDFWSVYSAVYVNGNTKSLHLVWASPGDGVTELRWDTEFIGVSRVFDGKWHFVSIAVTNLADTKEALLFVDGETNLAAEGWKKCISTDIPTLRHFSKGDRVRVLNQRQETAKTGGTLIVGHINAGLYDFAIYTDALNIEKVMDIGAAGMDLYSKIAVKESLTLGTITLLFAGVIILRSMFEGWQTFFGITEEDIEQTEGGNRRAATTTETSNAMTRQGGSSVQFWQFVQPVTMVGQTMGMYLAGWEWPVEFENYLSGVFQFLSLDFLPLFPNVPVIVWPLVQFFLGTFTLFALLHFAIRDEERHKNIIANYKETIRARQRRNFQIKKTEDERPKPHYSWVIHEEDGKTRPITKDQEDTLHRNMHELLTSKTKKDMNMRVHTKKLVDMGDLGTGIFVYERQNGKISISFRSSSKALMDDQEAETIEVVETFIECVTENVECPEHNERLLPDDMMTYTCVHSDNPLYRSAECPRNCVMYRCPSELCEYAVCEFCYNGGAGTTAMADALAKLNELKKHGATGTIGTIIVIISGVVYLPVVKNAMMILVCHAMFQCEFEQCWSNPDMKYIVAALMCFLTLLFIAIGFVVVQMGLLILRHRSLVAVLPVRKAQYRYNFWFLPQNLVYRSDYVEYLKLDNSMLKSLYEPFEFSYFWVGPAQLLFKWIMVAGLVLAEPNSLTQLSCSTVIEVVYSLLLVSLSPYKNVWVESLARIGSFHQLVQLGLMSLHRVNIREDPSSDGYGAQMIAVTILYLCIVGVLLLVVVVVPAIKKWWDTRQRRKREDKNEIDDIYDIGFWGNPNRRFEDEDE